METQVGCRPHPATTLQIEAVQDTPLAQIEAAFYGDDGRAPAVLDALLPYQRPASRVQPHQARVSLRHDENIGGRRHSR